MLGHRPNLSAIAKYLKWDHRHILPTFPCEAGRRPNTTVGAVKQLGL